MSSVWGRGVVRGCLSLLVLLANGTFTASHAEAGCSSQKSQQSAACPQPLPAVAPRLSADDAEKLKTEYAGSIAPWFLQGGAVQSDQSDEPVGLPFTINPSSKPSGNGFSAKMSTRTWRENTNKDLEKRIGKVKAAAPKDIKMPTSPRQIEPPAELWSTLEVQGVSTSGDSSDQSVRGGVGANYKMTPSATVGVSAERGAAKAANDASPGDDEKLSAFMNFKATSMLSIDARTQWQANQPSAALGATPERSEKGSIIVAPRISRTYKIGKDQTVEPFVSYKREVGIVTAGPGSADANSAGAGVTFAKPDAYSFSVTTDVDKLDQGADKSVSGKVQIKLPLP
jgi:hypothetical protein